MARRTRGLVAPVLALAATLAFSEPVVAHGPCSGCTTPKRGPVGTTVRVRWTAVKVVWNPGRRQDPYGQLNDVYHPGERSVTVFTAKRPRKSRFRVPRAAPGRYGIAIYDGSEGGTHYTWSYVTIRRDPPAAAAAPRSAAGGDNGAPWIVGGAVGLAVLLMVASIGRRRG